MGGFDAPYIRGFTVTKLTLYPKVFTELRYAWVTIWECQPWHRAVVLIEGVLRTVRAHVDHIEHLVFFLKFFVDFDESGSEHSTWRTLK